MMDSRPGTLRPASESKLAQLMRSLDWATTPLGRADEWAPELKSAAAFVLESPLPAALVAGPQLVTIHNDAFRRLLGDKPEATGRSFADVWSEAWEELRPLAERALAGEAILIENYPLSLHGSGKGEQAYFTFSYSPVRTADGEVIGFIDIVTETTSAAAAHHESRKTDDVTEQKRDQERMSLLVAELQHRVRNVLAMIRSIIRRTSGTKSDVTDFVRHLEGRIEAMARTQALLTRSPGKGVDLEDLVRDEMLAQAAEPTKFTLSGPSVSLPPKAAEVLTLAIHELATNSVKYGVLGQSHGRVAASWRSETLDGDQVLNFIWRETGLVLDNEQDRRRGFGTELITRRVPYELNGEGELSFEKGALTATIEFPVEAGYSILKTDPARWMRGAL